ncbi:MAG: insulinase family protein [Oscillospiraceae bacterium]|nr:insulinase family protein [Oscillospiraceae bacterium]
MDKLPKREKIAEGVHFNTITDPRYKFNRITAGFFAPLDEETASLYALIPRLFHRANADYPKSKDFNNYLASLYNAKSGYEVFGTGDTQFLGIYMNFMDDNYALHGEKITEEAVKALFNCVFNQACSESGDEFADNAAVELCKREQIEAIESEINDKRTYASNQARRILYQGEAAAVNMLGDVERTREITPQTLFKAYQKLLKSAVIEIFCVGCNDFSDALKQAKKEFSALERGKIYPAESAYSPLKPQTAETTERLPLLNQSKMVLGFKTDLKGKEIRPAITLMSLLYGGTISSKLFLNVRERLSLCYYCWSQFSANKGVMSVSCGVEESKIEEAKAEILTQLENVKKGDFTDEELNSALLHEQNSIKTTRDSLSSLTWWYISLIYMKDIKSAAEILSDFEKVTREDIIKTANSMKLDTFYVLSGLESNDEEMINEDE